MSYFENRLDFEIEIVVAVDVTLIGRDVLKTLRIDQLTQLEVLRPAGKLKETKLSYDSFQVQGRRTICQVQRFICQGALSLR